MESCFCIYQRMSDTHCKYTEYRTQAYPLGRHHQKIQICKRQQLSRVFSVVLKKRLQQQRYESLSKNITLAKALKTSN